MQWTSAKYFLKFQPEIRRLLPRHVSGRLCWGENLEGQIQKKKNKIKYAEK